MFENLTKALIITGNLSPMHDWRYTNQMLRKSLEASGHFIVKICEDFHGMTAEALKDYDVLIINYDGAANGDMKNPVTLGAETEKVICDFVAGGKGIFFFHSSTMMKPPFSEEYIKLAGSHDCVGKYKSYKDTGYTIDVIPGHPITEGVEPHWMLCDDDFFNWVELDDDCTVLATIYDPANDRNVPCFWCKEYGNGRVFGSILGHQQDTLRRLDYCRLLIRGCDWAANGTVTAPMPTRDSNDDWMRSWPWYYTSPIGRLY